eukprot:497374-Amphidinium_carterae.1
MPKTNEMVFPIIFGFSCTSSKDYWGSSLKDYWGSSLKKLPQVEIIGDAYFISAGVDCRIA